MASSLSSLAFYVATPGERHNERMLTTVSIPQSQTNTANSGHSAAHHQTPFTHNSVDSAGSGGADLPPLSPLALLKRAGRDARLTGVTPRLMIMLYTPINTWQALEVTALADDLACGIETVKRAVRTLRKLRYIEERPSHTSHGREVRFDLNPEPGGHTR